MRWLESGVKGGIIGQGRIRGEVEMPYMRYTILLFFVFIVLEISFILVLLSWHFFSSSVTVIYYGGKRKCDKYSDAPPFLFFDEDYARLLLYTNHPHMYKLVCVVKAE